MLYIAAYLVSGGVTLALLLARVYYATITEWKELHRGAPVPYWTLFLWTLKEPAISRLAIVFTLWWAFIGWCLIEYMTEKT